MQLIQSDDNGRQAGAMSRRGRRRELEGWVVLVLVMLGVMFKQLEAVAEGWTQTVVKRRGYLQAITTRKKAKYTGRRKV